MHELARYSDVRVTLIDRNNYHQFQPLLYQVATCQIPPSDVAYSLRRLFHEHANVHVKLDEVIALDPDTQTVTTADGDTWTGDAVVLAAGSVPNFFRTPGADVNSFPLYSLGDADRLRSRILRVFEDADSDSSLIDRGALNFVVVGGGPTGVEVAGALGDMIHETMGVEYRDLAVTAAQVHVVDLGRVLLSGFSSAAHDYAAKVLQRKGVRLHMGVAASEVAPDHVKLADGTTIRHALRRVGRRPDGGTGGGRVGPAAGPGRSHRRAPGSDRRGHERHLRRGRHREHPWPRRASAPPARLGGAAEWHLRSTEHPRGPRRPPAPAVPLPRHVIFLAGAADRLLVDVGFPHQSQVWYFRVLAVALPIAVFFLVRRICRELQASEARPLRAWTGTMVRRAPDGSFEELGNGAGPAASEDRLQAPRD